MHDSALLSPYQPDDELPARPRRRLLTPATVALMLVLFAACGFLGGVLVEKGQTSSSATLASTATGAGRFGGAGTGATGAGGGAAAGGGFASRLGSAFGGGAGGATTPTIGTVTNISGDKLYVTTTAGTMVEVITTPESKVTKSESVGRRSVHPGDSVVISGLRASNGTVTASSVTDSGSSASAAGGGFASLFGGQGASSGATSSSGGTASLFGG
jgi:hypothetical protein